MIIGAHCAAGGPNRGIRCVSEWRAGARQGLRHPDTYGVVLCQRFELLSVGSRDALPRHRTLRALVDWSYDLLADDERTLFERLSVFTVEWTLDAAEAICGQRGLRR